MSEAFKVEYQIGSTIAAPMLLTHHPDLWDWTPTEPDAEEIKPWRPRPLDHEHWPPNYQAVYQWRIKQLAIIRAGANGGLVGAMEYYRTRPAEFIMHWMDTYDPRVKVGPKWMPFVMFNRQAEFIEFLQQCERDGEGGLVEKCRDAGATWLACGYSVHKWLFEPGAAIGWGSRKQELVDRLGDDSSIFEKLRKIIKRLPKEFRPAGLRYKDHLVSMKIINPDNGATIIGEIGDEIGRGGRTTLYFKDESAHYERPDLIEASLGDNTNVQIDISSVNGTGNVFYRRRSKGVIWERGKTDYEPGYTRVFIIDWRDHPAKTQEWYDLRRSKAEREGLLHKFAQEVDRDYSGAVANRLIELPWVKAAIDADKVLKARWPEKDWTGGQWGAALDVADDGGDTNALAKRQGIVLRYIEEWGERDPGVTARRAIDNCRQHKGIELQYDSVGIGTTVKSEFNRLVIDEGVLDRKLINLIPWSAGASVLDPFDHIIMDDEESELNKDYFDNLKAQAWWSLRTRFWKTYQAVVNGVYYDPSELIIIDGSLTMLSQIEDELCQPTYGKSTRNLKLTVEKKPDGAFSPNVADAIMMCYFPVPSNESGVTTGNYGSLKPAGQTGYRK